MSQPSLLVADDEAGVRESLRLIFGKDFQIREAKSSEEAVRAVKEEQPDIILLDILMPGSDGLEILKRIKAIDPEGQVIMLTALNTAPPALTPIKHGPV